MDKFNFYGKYFKTAFLLIIIAETISFLAYNFPLVNKIAFFIIILGTLVISIKKLEYGLWIVLAELFIASKGYLFSLDVNDFTVSIRLGLFLVLFLAWLFYAIKNKKFTFKNTNLFWPFIALIGFLIIGIIVGYLKNNDLKNIFLDVNGYLYFGLIFVVFEIITNWEKINRLFQVLFAAVSAMALKTLFLLFYFSHVTAEGSVRLVYRWVRVTGVGEITEFAQNFYRIFFQSHIYSLFAFLIISVLLILTSKKYWQKSNYRILWLIVILSSLTLIISFSRSFWLALGLTILLIFLYLLNKEKIGFKRLAKIIGIIVLITTLEIGFLTFLVNIKLISGKSGGTSTATLIKERLTETDEAALGSRWQLIKPLTKKFLESPFWGSGFGTEVTYKTLDPRTKEENGGYYTSYAFEWGYLDIIVKIGLIGILIYLFFIWKILKNGLDQLKIQILEQKILTLGLLFSLIALVIAHFTTPYLNHPLGIGFLMICSAIFFSIKKNPSSS